MRFSHSPTSSPRRASRTLWRGLFTAAIVSSTYYPQPHAAIAADAPATTAVQPAAEKALADKLPWDDAEPIPPAIAEKLQNREYADAVALLDQAAAEPKAPRARLLYAKGRALYQAGKYDDAIAAFGVVEKEFAKDAWARRARFARAVALAKKGDFASAETLYRAEAEYLLSHERKQELADVYLSFARKYAKPRDEKSPADQPPPDFPKALQFFAAALELGPKPSLRPEIELQMAECHRLSNNFPEAIRRYEEFVKQRASDERIIEARFRLGESYYAVGDKAKARHVWQDLLASVPADKKPARPQDEEFMAQGAFLIGSTYGMPAPDNDDQLALGTAALEAMIERFPASKPASAARVSLVGARIHRGRYADAAKTAELLLNDSKRADSDEAADIRRLLGLALRQQKKFTQALAVWREFLVKHPTHAAWSEVQQRIIETEYLIGLEAFEKKDYVEARKQWNEFLLRYPLDPRSSVILFQFGRAEYLAEKWDAAIAEWRRLVSKYPQQEISSQAQMLIGVVLEEKKLDPTAAMAEYVKVTWGSRAAPAQQRIAQLRAKQLRIATERIFRSNETPYIKLDSRNVDKVTVRVYTVDLETYFRKMHLARGIESLDLALIDPDRSFEYTVPDYAEFKPCESRIELKAEDLSKAVDDAAAKDGADAKQDDVKQPDTKPSVVAVTISSKTLEATTLVVRSDLDMIVKSSRDEVFVFAQNMISGKPWNGARILVSNGTEVVAEGTTAADGTFRGSYKELAASNDVRVFAAADGNTASNVVSLQGVGIGQGLQERGFLYTERGGYQPGQVVHVRGILRGTADDRYVVVPKKKYRFETYDVRNRLIHASEVTTGEFGTFHTYFTLPQVAVPGDYRIQVCDIDGRMFQGAFRVENYALEPVRLSIDVPRKVYFRGEEITGTIKAEYYYGTPLVGREVRYTLGDGRVETGLTDAQGQVAFKYPTREMREHQTLTLTAQLPERNLATTTNLLIAVRAFSAAVKIPRDVVTTGESFAVEVSTNSADGKPTAEKLTLKVIERTLVDGKPGELEVKTVEIATDEKTGLGRTTLVLDKAATYILRAEGRDRFGNVVGAQHDVTVSGDDDAIRLRILADQHHYKAGDTAKFRVHWREAPALALVTFQGAKNLDYRLVELKTGDNILDVPLSERFAPNFQLEVNVMTDVREAPKAARVDVAGALKPVPRKTRLHKAANGFFVDRALTVKLETKRKDGAAGPAAPGETVDIVVRTLDAQGKPVAAEVALALIDRMNFDRFPGARSTYASFFNGVPRVAAMRTTSSIDFEYRPGTVAINARLLSEDERKEVAELDAARFRAFQQNAANQPASGVGGSFSSGGRYEFRSGNEPRGQMPASGGFGGGFGGRIVDTINGDTDDALMLGVGVNSNAGLMGGIAPLPGDNIQNFAFYVGNERGNNVALDGIPESNLSGAFTYSGSSTLSLGNVTAAPTRPQTASVDGPYTANDFKQMPGRPQSQSTVGAAAQGVFSSDLDIPFQPIEVLRADPKANVGDAWGMSGFRTIDAEQYGYYQLGDRQAAVINGGVLSNLDRAQFENEAEGKLVLAKLKEQGALLLLGAGLQETAYWNPSINTDAQGTATVAITLPERSTAWKLLAQGLTMDTRVGDAESELVVKDQLFGELALPSIATDGDKLEVIATIHDDRPLKLNDMPATIEVTLKTTIGGKSTEEKRTIEAGQAAAPAAGARLRELTFPIAIDLPKPEAANAAAGATKPEETAPPESAELTLAVVSGTERNVVRRTLPIRPYGFPVVAVDGGTTTTGTTVWLDQPAGMTLERRRLEILVGPSVDRSLLEIVLGGRRWCDLHESYATQLETSTSDLLAALALQKLIAQTRDKGTPEAAELDARIRSAVGFLASAQNDDGGWSWSGSAGTSNRYASARVVWALSAAKAGGYVFAQETFDKGTNYLVAQQAAVADDDLEGKAVLLHALAEAGRGDFAVANRLFRSRAAMSQAGIAYLALALAKMEHVPMAADLLTTFQAKPPVAVPAGGAAKQLDGASLSTARSGAAEVRALHALALLRAGVDVAKQKEAVDWLLAHRAGNRWSPEKGTGPAAAVLAEWFTKNRPGGEKFKLVVVVNDYEAANLEVDPNSPTKTIEIDAKHLIAGKQRIQLLMTGRGHLAYQCVLGGFVEAENLKPTVKKFYVNRTWEPALVEFDGKELPRGFSAANGNYSTFRNPLTQLPIGRRGRVELNVGRYYPNANPPDDALEYLVVREPIPAGCAVVEKSIAGGFERFEILPGELVFYVGNRRYPDTIRYELVGTTAGEYRVAQTIVVDAYRPEDFAAAGIGKLNVLARGRASTDPYRWSPDELYALGKRNFEKKNWEEARKHLLDLTTNWTIDPEPYLDSLKMLLDVHLELNRDAEIVKYFELVKEKSPELEFSFEKILRVGAAYHALGEYERSYLVFRATVESSFVRDAAVAGFLDAQGEFLRSVDVMRRLNGEYPPEPYVAAAEYALAQQVYGYAPRANDDPKLRERKLTKLALVAAAEQMLDSFLTAHPDDPAADQAAFADANALLEMEQYDRAVKKCLAFIARYPKSELLDSYWYVVGYSHFAAGRPEEALEVCRKVAEMKHVEPSGRETESRNKQRAIYILGQVYHSLGKAAEAIREYTRIADQIPDAKLAIDYFAHRNISLPEVTTIRPQDPTKVTLKFRNVPKCDVKAYRIDLMKFSLLRQNLSAITQINLSGIRPLYENTIDLGDGKDYRDREHVIDLPLKGEGAYLVVCRGENLHASGFVLVSPLKVEVQEEPQTGEVRATVKNVTDDKFVADIHVKVIGSRDGEFKAGETDLRGVFAAEPISGRTTVIAQAGSNRYAFYRGEKDLLPVAEPTAAAEPSAGASPPQQRKSGKAGGKEYLLEELQRDNSMRQQIQIDNLRNNYYNNPNGNGVKAKAAF